MSFQMMTKGLKILRTFCLEHSIVSRLRNFHVSEAINDSSLKSIALEGSMNSQIFPPFSQKYRPAAILIKWKSLQWWSHEQFQHCRNCKIDDRQTCRNLVQVNKCFIFSPLIWKKIACISVWMLSVTLSSELQGVYYSQHWKRFSLPPLPLIKSVFSPSYNRIVLFYCGSLNLGVQKKKNNKLRLILRSCELVLKFYSAVYEKRVLEERG